MTMIEPRVGPAWFASTLRRHFHNGRGGRAKLALTSSLGGRILLASVSLVTMPITVRYLGNEGYGLLVVMSGVVGWLQFSSLGIGVALQNPLTDARAARDSQLQAELLSTALFSLLAIAAVLLLAGALAFPVVDWLRLFPPTTDRFVGEIPTALTVVYLGFLISLVLSVVTPVCAARQELHLSSIPAIAAGVCSLGATVLAVQMDLGLVGMVLATIGTPLSPKRLSRSGLSISGAYLSFVQSLLTGLLAPGRYCSARGAASFFFNFLP